MISSRRQIGRYVLCDYIGSNIAWLLFNIARFHMPAVTSGYALLSDFLLSPMVLCGQLFTPLLMMAVYYLSGYYNTAFFKSRLQELSLTIGSVSVNTLLIFFSALINDVLPMRLGNYELLLLLFGIQFICVYAFRLTITTDATHKIHHRVWEFNTLVIGCGQQALHLMRDLDNRPRALGYRIVGYVDIGEGSSCAGELNAPTYRNEPLEELCQRLSISEIIVSLDDNNPTQLNNVVDTLYPLNRPIKIQRDKFHRLAGRVRLSNIYGTPFVDVCDCTISECEKNIKRLCDVIVSAIVLVIVSPLIAMLAILIKRDSQGPVFFKQERMGYHHKPFNIYKLRTMYLSAEADGTPRLSSLEDKRITRVGKILRKYRFDELPQFWNVLKGDMSLVGPRPEREYFIRQIMKKAPYYALMYQIRPGITSWGMVKYGYARNIDEMIDRLQYDVIYLENMSLLVDLKIIIYTVRTVFMGRGM